MEEGRMPEVIVDPVDEVTLVAAPIDVDQPVRNWYASEFPWDRMDCLIDPDVTFGSLATALECGVDPYDALGVADSAVRQRAFAGVAEAVGVPYDRVYDVWVAGGGDLGAREADSLRCVVVRPSLPPVDARLYGDVLHGLQGVVGGRVDCLSVRSDGVDLWVRDDGVFSDVPNRTVLADADMERDGLLSQIDGTPVREGEPYTLLFGTVVALGYDPETGESVGLTDEQAASVARDFELGRSGPEPALRAVGAGRTRHAEEER